MCRRAARRASIPWWCCATNERHAHAGGLSLTQAWKMLSAGVSERRSVMDRPRRLQMRIVRRFLAVTLAVLLVAPAAQAQSHVVSKAGLAKAVAERVSQEQADRAAILALLQRADVQTLAARAGLPAE